MSDMYVYMYVCMYVCMHVCTKSFLKTTTNSSCVCTHLAIKADSDSDSDIYIYIYIYIYVIYIHKCWFIIMFYCIMQCIRDVLLNRTRRCRWGTVQYWVRVCVITLWCNTMLLSTLCLWESCSFSNYWEALCLLRWDFTSYSYFYNDCSFAWWTCCVR